MAIITKDLHIAETGDSFRMLFKDTEEKLVELYSCLFQTSFSVMEQSDRFGVLRRIREHSRSYEDLFEEYTKFRKRSAIIISHKNGRVDGRVAFQNFNCRKRGRGLLQAVSWYYEV